MITVVAVAAVFGVSQWSCQRTTTPNASTTTPSPTPMRAAAPAAVRHPLGSTAVQSVGALPPLPEADIVVMSTLGQLIGRKTALIHLRVDGLIQRAVATADNLTTSHTVVERWPVSHTTGQLKTEVRGGATVISPKNSERYDRLVKFVESVDTRGAVAWYVRLYPLFQQAYDDLGGPKKYFNDRLVEVIDDLLATPEIMEPLKVKLVETGGATKAVPAGEGGVYRYEDPTLEARSAGQKILLRIGPEHARTLKTKLVDVRSQIASGPAGAQNPSLSKAL